jgi:hypothetical protein
MEHGFRQAIVKTASMHGQFLVHGVAPIGWPIAVSVSASVSMLLEIQISGRMGSPRVAGSPPCRASIPDAHHNEPLAGGGRVPRPAFGGAMLTLHGYPFNRSRGWRIVLTAEPPFRPIRPLLHKAAAAASGRRAKGLSVPRARKGGAGGIFSSAILIAGLPPPSSRHRHQTYHAGAAIGSIDNELLSR